MPAESRNIQFEENADFEWNIQLETSNCSVIDITGYGMRMEVRDRAEGVLIFQATHADHINVNDTTDEFEIDIPQASVAAVKENFRLHKWKAVYDIIAFPGASTPTTDPVALFEGTVRYRPGVTELS